MKAVVITFALAIGMSVVLLAPSDRTMRPGSSKSSNEKAHQENCGCESASPKEDFPYANHMDPRQYREIYSAIQQMPGEDQIEGSKHKGLRFINASTAQWESFGPLGVADKGDPLGNQNFG